MLLTVKDNQPSILGATVLIVYMLLSVPIINAFNEDGIPLEKETIIQNLHRHLTMLTQTIGERSVIKKENLQKSVAYLQDQFVEYGLAVERQSYPYKDMEASNVVACFKPGGKPVAHYVIGAHYDSVAGTVGADDNASAVAVLLETARVMQASRHDPEGELQITFVAFALEEPPVFSTPDMGSRVFANKAQEASVTIDGMICLEMVGYTCNEPGCQEYPFPLQFFGYPETGNFIGIIGNVKSMGLTRRLKKSFRQNPHLPVVSLTVPFNGWIMPAVRLSDHASFWDKGYRAVMLTDSAFFRNPHYHKASDTMQTLDLDYMAELVKSLVGFFRE
jgi:Zn-dependent M28 family amino/carboxypeptidase